MKIKDKCGIFELKIKSQSVPVRNFAHYLVGAKQRYIPMINNTHSSVMKRINDWCEYHGNLTICYVWEAKIVRPPNTFAYYEDIQVLKIVKDGERIL